MRSIKTVVAALLLGLWVPTTSHVLLEQLDWIHTDHDDSDDPGKPHDAADGICRIASHQVHAPPVSNEPVILPSSDFRPLELCEPVAVATGPDPPGVAPPEISHRWQFSYRASLPPRAPSLFV